MAADEAANKRVLVRGLIRVDRSALSKLCRVFLPLCVTSIGLLTVSAAVFQALEQPHEHEQENAYLRAVPLAKDEFCSDVAATLGVNADSVNCSALLTHVFAYNSRLDGFETAIVQGRIDWGYWNSMVFATSVTSTIGWGNLVPKTAGGKWLTIVLCFIGIPINLGMIASMALILKRVVHFLTARIELECLWVHHVVKVKMHGHYHEELKKSAFHPDNYERLADTVDTIHHIPAVVLSVVFTFAYICLTAIWYKSDDFDLDDDAGTSHDGHYLSGVYYSIVTFTTVGFGDFNIGQDARGDGGRVIGFILSVYVGVSLVSMTLAVIQHAFSVLGFTLEVVDGDDSRMIHVLGPNGYAARMSNRDLVTSPQREVVGRIVRKAPSIPNDDAPTSSKWWDASVRANATTVGCDKTKAPRHSDDGWNIEHGIFDTPAVRGQRRSSSIDMISEV
eukprot:CAMPEP_0206292658 /NCGR_PEP_ID=MMETSP0106_2-20121207/3742_1 /ASSEMBLY_ACC=CAM_ASM_000206 /TAXON_ID=81532 /ORGANISM="Acanthoeca-like sp., Strain 10tr" /LENGTH=447 /DNA_ID=CAMNT_0053723243 /DNA_START=177 /DNA_END=1520 /DNA_ORIENTATION=+